MWVPPRHGDWGERMPGNFALSRRKLLCRTLITSVCLSVDARYSNYTGPATAQPTRTPKEEFMRRTIALSDHERSNQERQLAEQHKACIRSTERRFGRVLSREELKLLSSALCSMMGGTFGSAPPIHAFADWQYFCLREELYWQSSLNDK